MAIITLKYDDKNAVIKSILNAAVEAGATVVESKTHSKSKKLSPIEKSMEDISKGRVTRVENIDNVVEEILR